MKNADPKLKELQQFIRSYNFATLVSAHEGKIELSHAPMLLKSAEGKHGTLAWHLAKNNPQVPALSQACPVLGLFQGPHAYISPRWYQSSPNVPTWNYALVRVWGRPRLSSVDELAADLKLLTQAHEGASAALVPYKASLLKHIIGFQMELTQIEGVFKLGQNRNTEDRQGMLEGLRKEGKDQGQALADFIEKFSEL